MILDKLNIPGLTYEILEADKRFGGRVYTHRFSDPKDAKNPEDAKRAKHDYYDVGAMRFPDIDIMQKYVVRYNSLICYELRNAQDLLVVYASCYAFDTLYHERGSYTEQIQ